MPNINLRTVGATPQGPVENVVGADGYVVPADVGKVLTVQPDGTIGTGPAGVPSSGYAVPADVGKVLTVQPDGTIAPAAAAGGTVVASFFAADVADVSTEPALNGVFYTAPSNGWFRLTWVMATFAAFQPGVDSGQVNAYVGPASVDSVQASPSLRLYQGGEGTQAASFNTPADVYLRAGQTLQLQGAFGVHLTIGIQLTRIM